MKLNKVLSSDLPEISASIKECINSGRWLLFKSASIDKNRSLNFYYLKVDDEIFELNAKGMITKSVQSSNANLHIDELYYFSDLPQPRSMSNTTIESTSIFA